MSAQIAVERTTTFQGLRPLDPRRDLGQVALLIEEAFSGELESGGLAALRDMRMLARMGPLVGLMARSDPYLEDVLGGFVWVEDGRVVGNVTIQRLDPYASRWQIANVAVTRDYQGRGIGRALVSAAVDRIDMRGGGWAVLQVRADNPVAMDLYRSLGFEPVNEEMVLILDKVPAELPDTESLSGLQAYHHSQWQARHTLEAASQTEMAKWWRPVRSHNFIQPVESRAGERVAELFGRNRVRRWVVEANNGLAAYLEVDARHWQGVHRIVVTVHPACRGDLESQLLSYALGFLKDYRRWPVRVEHPGEHLEMVEALDAAGFRLVRNHLSMRKKLNA